MPTFNIYASLAPKKMITTQEKVFKNDNVNSAATDTIKNIIIYRDEELLKSILHECFHFHNMEFNFNDYPSHLIKNLLSIKENNLNDKNELRLSEAYCETMANLLNIIFTLTKLDYKI